MKFFLHPTISESIFCPSCMEQPEYKQRIVDIKLKLDPSHPSQELFCPSRVPRSTATDSVSTASVCRCTQLYASLRSSDRKAPSRKTAADIRREFRRRCIASRSPRGSARERTRQPSWRNQSGSCLSSLREPESRSNNSQEPYSQGGTFSGGKSPGTGVASSLFYLSFHHVQRGEHGCFNVSHTCLGTVLIRPISMMDGVF